MNFLNPWFAAAVAAVVVPLLVLLYFLKLRRREQRVATTLLWKKAIQDLQVNAPFQRLRKNLLLFLQLLILGCGVFALARPVVKSALTSEKSIVLLVDHSGSMKAVEGSSTRLALAKEQAIRLVRTLNQTGAQWLSWFGAAPARTRVMVISFADRAQVIAPFTTNMTDVERLINEIEPSDSATNLGEALELAEAYMMQTRIEQTTESAESASRLVVLTDGCVGNLPDVVLRSGTPQWIKVGDASDNVGITSFRFQRSYEQPEVVSVFLQLQNFGPQPINTDVTLYVDGRLSAGEARGAVQSVNLGPARRRETPTSEPAAGAPLAAPTDSAVGGDSTSITFELTLDRAALLEARLVRDDALAADNRAWIVVPPPRKLQVLLVSDKNPFLERVLSFLPIEKYKYLTPAQYEAAPKSELEADGRSLFDVVVMDKHDTQRLPVGNYLFIGCLPKIPGVEATGEAPAHLLMWWDDSHPVLRHVDLEYVMAAKSAILKLPREAQPLIEGPQGPFLARYAREGSQFLILAAPLEATTWVTKPSFPIFAYNALRFLGSSAGVSSQEPLRPGETLRMTLPAGQDAAVLNLPGAKKATLKPDSAGVVRFAATDAVGVYTLEKSGDPPQRFAVNLESARESDIVAPAGFTVGGQAVTKSEGIKTATPEVWRWFVGGALVVALIEWYIYNRRVMI